MRTTIVTHPANARLLESKLNSGEYNWQSITVRSNECMGQDKPTGRFVLPDGSIVERAAVVVHSPFVTYRSEDIH